MPFTPWSGSSSSSSTVARPYQFFLDSYNAKGDGKQALVNVTNASPIINTAPLGAPGSAPTVANSGSGGTILAGTYQVEVTYVNQWGETTASASASTTTSGSVSTITVSSPGAWQNATGWYAYITLAGGSTYYRQQSTPIPIQQSFTLTTPPAVTVTPPGADSTAAQVFTSTAVDAGKNIMISGALAGGGTAYLDTILTVQSPTQATMAGTGGNPTQTIAGCAMVFSSDDRLAIDSCVQAAEAYVVATGNNFVQIVASNKIYGLGSGLFQTTIAGSGLLFNTQFRIPVPWPSGQMPKVEWQIVGPGDNAHTQFWVNPGVDVNGACFVSYSLGPTTADPTFGQQSVIGAPTGGLNNNGSSTFGNQVAVIKGVQVIQPAWSNGIGVDLSTLAGCVLRGSAMAFSPSTNTGGGQNPSSGWPGNSFFDSKLGTGLRAPSTGNNDDMLIESWNSEGLTFGVSCQADHMTVARLTTINCFRGLYVANAGSATHALTIAQWSFEGCTSALYNNAGGHIMCNITMDGENTACADVTDSANGFYGVAYWDDPFRVSGTPTISGAANLQIINCQLGPGHMASPPAVPASTVAATPVFRNAQVKITTGAGVTVSAITVDGTVTGQTVAAASTLYPVGVPSGKTIALTYAGGTPTWDWWLS